MALTIHSREHEEAWVTTVLGEGDVLALPEIGIEIPIAAIYDEVSFDEA